MSTFDHLAVAAAVPGAQRRLEQTLARLTDDEARAASALPGWSRAHVATHIARNGDAMVRLLTGALHGTPAVQYPGGAEGRAADIEAGAGRAASELVADVIRSDEAVDAAFAAMTDEAWTNTVEFRDGRVRTADRCASSRWREVEIHHVDLDLDRYTIADWPAEFVAFVLPGELSRLGKRLGAGQAVEIGGIRYGSGGAAAATVDGPDFAVLAWLIGRPRLAAPHLDTAALPELPPWG